MVITEPDLARLPDPVARYLKKTGVVGKQPVKTVRLRQRGRFRMGQTGGWAALVAEQRYTIRPPTFIWRATISPSPVTPVKVVDAFVDGHGRLQAKLFGLFTMADARGPEVDRGELLRFMSEIVWFPTAWLCDFITWQAADARSAVATIAHAGVTASATLFFDDEDRVVRVEAKRYRLVGKTYSLDPWMTPASGHREVNGLLIPMKGQAIWRLPSGDFSYFDGEVTELEYDTPGLGIS